MHKIAPFEETIREEGLMMSAFSYQAAVKALVRRVPDGKAWTVSEAISDAFLSLPPHKRAEVIAFAEELARAQSRPEEGTEASPR